MKRITRNRHYFSLGVIHFEIYAECNEEANVATPCDGKAIGTLTDVLDVERQEIKRLRKLRMAELPADAPVVGLAFSGGGIRSATIPTGHESLAPPEAVGQLSEQFKVLIGRLVPAEPLNGILRTAEPHVRGLDGGHVRQDHIGEGFRAHVRNEVAVNALPDEIERSPRSD